MKSVFKLVAAQPSVELYDRAKAYSLFKDLGPELRATREFPTRERVWDECLRQVGAHERWLYLEFGVYKGESISYFSDHLTHRDARLFGFDSFEGLPERWGPNPKGTFSLNGVAPRIHDTRAEFVKGWFHETLPLFFERPIVRKLLADPSTKVFVHLDADLYSSTLFVLTTLWHYLDRYYFCFDEFMGHELRALQDFRTAYPSKVEFFAYDLETGFPTRMAGRLENKRPRTANASTSGK
jgi:hypothetical protein